MKRRNKRILTWVLIFSMVLSSLSSVAYAATGEEIVKENLPGPEIKKLAAERIDELNGQEAVYFGTASADIVEGDKYYSLPVYREGDLQNEASVKLLALDISALYGSDYELCLDDVETVEHEQTLLQKGNGANSIVSNEEAMELAAQAQEDENQTDDDLEESDYGDELGPITQSIFQALNINAQTKPSDEQVSEALSSEKIDYSAATVLKFEKGESEKTITFRLMEDKLEEGQEMFWLALADAKGTEVKKQATFSAVIDDNEELHDASISFDARTYCSKNGKVTITINRTGSDYSLIDFYLRSEDDTALAGENYEEFEELLNMQPYQTSVSYTFDVCGTGKMNVVLVPSTSCEVKGSDTASVLISETIKMTLTSTSPEISEIDSLYEVSGEDEEPQLTQAYEYTKEELNNLGIELGENEHAFPIKIGDQKFTVKYKGNGENVTVGGIYKESEFKGGAPRVGDYVFVSPKTTDFGFHTGDPSTALSEYIKNDDANKAHGHIYWFSRLASDEGDSSLITKKDNAPGGFSIGSTYYRSVTPDWQGLHWAGFQQEYQFTAYSEAGSESRVKKWGAFDQGACFDRKVDNDFRMYLPVTMDNEKLKLAAYAKDVSSCITKVGLNVYGFVCMYKAYNIRMEGFSPLTYRSAGGGKVDSIPFRLQNKSGVGSTYSYSEYRTVYADSTGEQCKVTFSASDVYLSGHSGIYGYITGYNLTYNSDAGSSTSENGKHFKTVKYPDDFYKYLRETSKKPPEKHDLLDYSATAVEQRIRDDEGRVVTINFDAYLIDWLTSIELSLKEHRTKWDKEPIYLSFQPIVDYFPVTVVVQEPDLGKDTGKFTNSELTVGEHKGVYHAGDTLDVGTIASKAGYVAAGYEYTTDTGKSWTAVTNSKQLFLTSDISKIYIRPLMTTENNKIRIEFIGDAEKYITVDNTIDEDDLKGTPYSEMTLIDVNPTKSDVVERARPEIGELYPINVFVDEKAKEAGYEYRPYFVDKMYSQTEHINSQVYPFVAKAKETDNVIKIGVEKVRTSNLRNITVSGLVQMEPLRALRLKGEKKTLTPVAGYQLASFEKQTVTKEGDDYNQLTYAATDKDGKYTLTKIRAKAGDIVPILISGSAGGSETGYVKVGNTQTVAADPMVITYPYLAPVMTSISYSFGNPDNNIKEDTNQTTVKILEDKIRFEITVDEKDRKVGKVILVKRKYGIANGEDQDEKPTGSIVEYEAVRQKKKDTEEGTDVWVLEIPNMIKTIYGGDRLFIRIVDEEKIVLPGGKQAQISYPTMDTGIEFYIAKDPKVPQDYSQTLDPTDPVPDIPFFGMASTKPVATSGMISWDSMQWPDEKGYTLSINLGVGIDPLSFAERKNRVETFQRLVENKQINDAFGEIIGSNTLTGKVDANQQYHNLEEQIALNRKARLLEGTDFSDPKMSTFAPYLSADVTSIISLYFVKQQGTYRYKAGAVVFSGTFIADFTWNTLFGPLPGYINFGVFVQIAYLGAWTMKDTVQGISVNNFLEKQGNVSETITLYPKKEEGFFNFIITGYLRPGVGSKKGWVGVRGNVDLTYNCGLRTPKKTGETNGNLVSVGGGIELVTPITNLSITIARFSKGFKAWRGYKEWQVFGFLIPSSPKVKPQSSAADLAEGEILSIQGNEITSVVPHRLGTPYLSTFGHLGLLSNSVDESMYSNQQILLDDAADYARIKTVQTSNNGDLFMVFGGNRGSSDENAEAIYYTTYNNSANSWSTPLLLDDDGTFDTLPNLTFDKSSRVVNVTWSSAEEPFKAGDSYIEKLSKLRIKTRSFTLVAVTDGAEVASRSEMKYLSGKLASPSSLASPSGLASPANAEKGEELDKNAGLTTMQSAPESNEQTAAQNSNQDSTSTSDSTETQSADKDETPAKTEEKADTAETTSTTETTSATETTNTTETTDTTGTSDTSDTSENKSESQPEKVAEESQTLPDNTTGGSGIQTQGTGIQYMSFTSSGTSDSTKVQETTQEVSGTQKEEPENEPEAKNEEVSKESDSQEAKTGEESGASKEESAGESEAKTGETSSEKESNTEESTDDSESQPEAKAEDDTVIQNEEKNVKQEKAATSDTNVNSSEDENDEEEDDEEEDEEALLQLTQAYLDAFDGKYYDVPINTWTNEDRSYCLFTRYDLSEVGSIEDILDYNKTKPAVYLSVYNEKTKVLEKLHNLKLTSGEKSILLEADAELIDVNEIKTEKSDSKGKQLDRSYLTISYTQDTDGNLKTVTDNDLKICFVSVDNTGETVVYPSINISDGSKKGEDGHAIADAQITELDSRYYLSYMKDGYQLEVADLSTYVNSMFAFDCLADYLKKLVEGGTEATSESKREEDDWYVLSFDKIDELWFESTGNHWTKNWEAYKKAGDPEPLKLKNPEYSGDDWIGNGQYTYAVFEDSTLESIGKGDLKPRAAKFNSNENMKQGISEYEMVSDGKNMYVIYTDSPEDTISQAKELFCVKLTLDENSTETVDDKAESYYSIPVQITDSGRVNDNFTAKMNKAGEITIISNSYIQTIPEAGGIEFSDNKTVVTKYKPRSILEIENAFIGTENEFSIEGSDKDTIRVSYSVKNKGLEPQNGYTTLVKDDAGNTVFEADMTTTILASPSNAESVGDLESVKGTQTTVTRKLRSGATDEFTFPWTVDNYGVGKTLNFYVAEKGSSVYQLLATTEKIESHTELSVTDASAYKTDEGIKVDITVKNTGNVGTEATAVNIYNCNNMGEIIKTVGTVTTSALQPGETCNLEYVYKPKGTEYTASGTIDFKAQIAGYEQSPWRFYYVAGDPEMLLIEEGEDRLYLKKGRSQSLETKAVPFGMETNDVIYSVDDPSIVSVSSNGTIRGLKTGTTKITAYSPILGLTDEIYVTVNANGRSSSGGSSGYELPSFVDKDGKWSMDANGNWSYTTKSGVRVTNKWIAIADSTFGKGRGYHWYRFDENGNMVTGWFRDSDDRTYYLQILSDGYKGAMYTGWHNIGGNQYYFEPVSNGHQGEMYVNRKSRDGYYFGADGKWDGKEKQ